MGKIVILDENTANKIAAGEVIERPASVVKELVENSIDAGASAISVEIKNGGITYIRVIDNGSGIDEDDVEIAFERHSTSKIRSTSDLSSITTMGFRGEALASIAAVSSVELVTRVKRNPYGMLVRVKGGEILEVRQTGCPVGTTFTVSELFYNTPARYKFLKKDATEAGYVSDIVSRIALGNPHISISLTGNGRRILHTPGNNDLLSAIFSIYGRETARNVVPVNYDDGIVKITGYAGKPEIARSNRNHQSFYINRRFIRNRIISSAVEEAYNTLLMKGRHAFVVLNLELNPVLVDVNVHPTKAEVRFSQEQDIFKSVYHAINSALLGSNLIRNITVSVPGKQTETVKPTTPDFQQQPIPGITRDYSPSRLPARDCAGESNIKQDNIKQEYEINLTGDSQYHNCFKVGKNQVKSQSQIKSKNQITSELQIESGCLNIKENAESKSLIINDNIGKNETFEYPAAAKDEVREEKRHLAEARYIGQAFSTFIILQHDNELLIIDQHAAHERILYEKLLKKYREKEPIAQFLLTPVVIELTNREMEIARENEQFFSSIGFIFEEFGNNSLILRAVPVIIDNTDLKNAFLETLDRLISDSEEDSAGKADDALYSMACKAAIKANRNLDQREIKNLVDELCELENPYSCPHGRPTIIRLSRHELEKMFKRIV